MKPLTSKYFRKLFPGPFNYRRDEDGVDETYDIYCSTTGKHVISTYFWVDSLALELEIQVICAALNHPLKFNNKPMLDIHERDRLLYFGFCPGPFTISPCHCDMRGSGWDVVSESKQYSVITSYETPQIAQLIAQSIADALTRFGT